MDLITFGTLAAGLLLLVVGGELLVRGASSIAGVLGISPLVIGLTVVAFGTSSPELAVSVQAALAGNPDIALGNVVGSNILNVLFILGLCALILPLHRELDVTREVSNSTQAHEMILQGIPGKALETLVAHLSVIGGGDTFEKAFGMSERTFQRHKSDRSRTLDTEQSSRTWSFARILTRATAVFGSQKDAEKWLIQPAMGLDNRRPIDLLATAVGTELVREFLERLDYGVYA